MLITRIKVVKLYGLHDYDITFLKEECVKIIHAPNGYGKTTILKLIKAVLDMNFPGIKKVPFESFLLTFDNQVTLEVTKPSGKIIYTLSDTKGQCQADLATCKLLKDDGLGERIEKIREQIPIYFIDANRLWLEERSSHESDEMQETYAVQSDAMQDMHRAYYGQSMQYVPNMQDTHSSMTPAVLKYAKELSKQMKEALAQSNFCGQALDSSLPKRLLNYLADEEADYLSPEEIKEELLALEKRRKLLMEIGLFSNEKMVLPEKIEHMDQALCKVMTLYIADSKEKLKVFDSLAEKIDLLHKLVNKRFSYKVMEVNMKDGFVFRVPTNEVLHADKLSSGEQNELILLFMLLFKAPEHAMILMDEPEISLHIAWQQSFLEDMEAVSQLAKVRIMIATHSPDIINGRWDLTTGLDDDQ